MRQPEPGQAKLFHTPPPTSTLRLSLLRSHQVAFLEVSGQLSVFTGENRAGHAEHDTEHRKQGEEGDLGKRGHRLRAETPKIPSTTNGATLMHRLLYLVNMNGRVSSLLGDINGHPLRC